MAFKCPKCEAEFYDRLKYCPECGFDFTRGQKRCPKCRQQIDVDSEICPECGLDFEQWSYFVPRLVVFSIAGLVLIIILVFPLIWKSAPLLHDKGIIQEGQLMSDVAGQAMVPMFIHWGTGERYIAKAAENAGYGVNTDFMDNLIPLPPEVIFHYDLYPGERVWIIQRKKGTSTDWVRIGRWGERKHDKYGWVHATNIRALE